MMDTGLWNKAVAFHGHECPGLAIGFKACEAARLKLGLGASPDEEIVCVTENDACGVDAVQSLLSCTFGKGNLIYRDTGKQAFSFFERSSGRKLRVCLRPGVKPAATREERMRAILDAPVDELFTFAEPRYGLPERARIFETVVCSRCGEGVPEHKARLQGGAIVCADCFDDYSRGF